MDHKFPFDAADGEPSQPIVYVRPIAVEDLPEDIRRQAGDVAELYSVHTADGERLALVQGRQLAFDLARQHDYTPVNVH